MYWPVPAGSFSLRDSVVLSRRVPSQIMSYCTAFSYISNISNISFVHEYAQLTVLSLFTLTLSFLSNSLKKLNRMIALYLREVIFRKVLTNLFKTEIFILVFIYKMQKVVTIGMFPCICTVFILYNSKRIIRVVILGTALCNITRSF